MPNKRTREYRAKWTEALLARERASDLREAVAKAGRRLVGNNPRIPIAIHEIAASCGYKVVNAVLDDGGEAIEDETGRPVIYVDIRDLRESWSRRRQRFTIAHEIGHLIIADAIRAHGGILALARQKSSRFASKSRIEQTCNDIAAEILMPRDVLIKAVGGDGATGADVRRLADEFDVSLKAMQNRVIKLGMWRGTYLVA